MKTNHSYLLFFLLLFLGSCTSAAKVSNDKTINSETVVTIYPKEVISEGYIGNGAQWDPYQMDYGKGEIQISEADWKKLYARLDFMRPQFIRVMINTRSLINNGKLNPEYQLDRLTPILDYCQSRNVTVMFGDWGGGMVNSRENTINETNLAHAVEFVDFLINRKGYSCIKYYNLINEPNGFWSVTDGNYSLWARAIRYFDKAMRKRNLQNQLSLVGPDAAIWTKKEAWWVDSCATGLKDIIGLYDIHTYPSKITVNSGEYSKIIQAYKNFVPTDKKIVMGEIGFKYVEAADSAYLKENIRRAKSRPYASVDDSQMFVYDYMYGTDMADALFQTINTGFSGSIVWMLDDAMHSKESPEKLKVWGFWNILGDEYFGAGEENVRPWYYAWSLLTKYIPAGSKVHKVTIDNNPAIKAVSVENEGKRTIAVVNVSKAEQTIKLVESTLNKWTGVKKFIYADSFLKKDGDHILLPNDNNLTLNLRGRYSVVLPAESMILFTDYNY